jgi:AFG3 family protein
MEQQNKPTLPPLGGNTPNKKGPKFNLYWIYGFFAVVLIALNFWNTKIGHDARPKQETFQTINKNFISKHLVDSMVVIGKTCRGISK